MDGKENAQAVAKMYCDANVRISPNCDLAKHIAAAVEVSDKWLSGTGRNIQAGTFFRSIQMERIASALPAARESPRFAEYLRHLSVGSLDIFERRPSKAKDTLWELELYALRRSKSVAASLTEPDIVAHINGFDIGIACKKIYSHKNIGKTLSIAVEQIEAVSEFGVIAINIDDLWPPNQIRVATSEEFVAHLFSTENRRFLTATVGIFTIPFLGTRYRSDGGIRRRRVC